MKINEVLQSPTEKLMERFNSDNDTGFATEDLVKMYRTDRANAWEEVDVDDLIADLDALEQMDREER